MKLKVPMLGLCLLAIGALLFRQPPAIQEPSYVIHRVPQPAWDGERNGAGSASAVEVEQSGEGRELGPVGEVERPARRH